MCPSGSGEIHTCCQAGGSTRARIRCRVAGSVTGAPDGSRYSKPSGVWCRVMPGPRGSLRVSPATAASPPVIKPSTSVPPFATSSPLPTSAVGVLINVFDPEVRSHRSETVERDEDGEVLHELGYQQ